MGTDPKIEQATRATRAMLGHAIRRELDDLAALMQNTGDDILLASVPLCLFVSAYIAIDVSGMQWPDDVELRKVARDAFQSATEPDITEADIYEYLSRVALGAERLDDVFSVEGVAMIPLLATASLLLTFRPQDKQWWEYLDQIWDAAEVAERMSLSVLPALMIRGRMEKALTGQSKRHSLWMMMQLIC